MTTNELENTPAVPVEDEYAEASSDDSSPEQKSGVRTNRDAPLPPSEFSKGERVRISETIGSARVRGSYNIHKSRYSDSKRCYVYQLIEPLSQTLYNNGAWVREREIRRDRR